MNRFLLLPLLAFVLAACSSSQATTDPNPDPTTDTPTVTYDLADYEDFDASVYPDAPPPAPSLEHRVPQQLMDNRAGRGTTQTLQGFRVQVLNTQDKQDAIQLEEDAKAWWRSLTASERPDGLQTLDVHNVYRQPYYRIRLGDFATRSEADNALAFIQQRFPNAFVIPDMVTVIR